MNARREGLLRPIESTQSPGRDSTRQAGDEINLETSLIDRLAASRATALEVQRMELAQDRQLYKQLREADRSSPLVNALKEHLKHLEDTRTERGIPYVVVALGSRDLREEKNHCVVLTKDGFRKAYGDTTGMTIWRDRLDENHLHHVRVNFEAVADWLRAVASAPEQHVKVARWYGDVLCQFER